MTDTFLEELIMMEIFLRSSEGKQKKEPKT